jgi:hypothetical protein
MLADCRINAQEKICVHGKVVRSPRPAVSGRPGLQRRWSNRLFAGMR